MPEGVKKRCRFFTTEQFHFEEMIEVEGPRDEDLRLRISSEKNLFFEQASDFSPKGVKKSGAFF